ILIHVADISHPEFEEQIAVVRQTLTDIGASDKPTIMLFNKIDLYQYIEKDPYDLAPATRENLTLEDLEKTWMAKSHVPSVFISATRKTNLPQLRNLLFDEVMKIRVKRYPSPGET
ncbi:MAG TPA: hypothetical protein VMC08_00300, partial [Bacteroidales bacterium]|nr:hypothetical protein [Bacteroidales bacterium]